MTKSKAKEEEKDYETLVLEGMEVARQHAKRIFGARCNFWAIHELFEYLSGAEDEGELLADLEAVAKHVARLSEEPVPAPEDVFRLFKTLYEPVVSN